MRIKYKFPYVRVEEILYFIVIILLLIIAGGNNVNPDYAEYEMRYFAEEKADNTGWILFLLGYMCMKIGIPFQGFRFLEAFLGLCLLSCTIKRYSKYPTFTLLLYSIYPYLLDVVQVGNFLGYTVVLYCMRYLEKKTLKNAIKYIVGIIISTQIHASCLMYIILLLVFIENKRLLIIVVTTIFFLITGTIKFLPRVIPYIPILKSSSKQISYYLSFNESLVNGTVAYAVLLVMLLVVIGFLNKYFAKKIDETEEERLSYYGSFLFEIFIVSLCFVPFILINSEFVRMIRNLWILYYCLLMNFSSKDRIKVAKFVAVFLALILFYKELSPRAFYYETVTNVIFRNNIFW